MIKKPSVTELLKLLDKPALLNWANKQGLQGIDIKKKSKEWLSKGTSIHNQIEEYIRNGTPFVNYQDEANFDRFISDKQILGYENKIETEWFTGIYDMKVLWNGKIYLIDFKRNSKRIYLENKLQLIAYGMAEKCDAYAIVSVPTFFVMNFKVDNKEPYEEIIKSLSNIYKNKQLIETINF